MIEELNRFPLIRRGGAFSVEDIDFMNSLKYIFQLLGLDDAVRFIEEWNEHVMFTMYQGEELKNLGKEAINDDEYHEKRIAIGLKYFYLALDERNLIAEADLSDDVRLSTQRDVFIFQCLVGCRVSDLITLRESNIVNGMLQYVPQKTKDNKPLTVTVPLNERASMLVAKYHGIDPEGRLFPFISPQKYNDAIKEVLTRCGVKRMVTVLNPATDKEEQRPINEVASSHMARRTFIGCLYHQVQDPNLIGSMSGHAEGSKAFARYRTIDDETKRRIIALIE